MGKMRRYDMVRIHTLRHWFVQRKAINLPSNYSAEPSEPTSNTVTGLTIKNEWGSVTWPETIDITDIDFSDAIVIGSNFVEIYPNDYRLQKPGTGLYRTCEVTYLKHPKVLAMIEDKRTPNEIFDYFLNCDTPSQMLLEYDPNTCHIIFRMIPHL